MQPNLRFQTEEVLEETKGEIASRALECQKGKNGEIRTGHLLVMIEKEQELNMLFSREFCCLLEHEHSRQPKVRYVCEERARSTGFYRSYCEIQCGIFEIADSRRGPLFFVHSVCVIQRTEDRRERDESTGTLILTDRLRRFPL